MANVVFVGGKSIGYKVLKNLIKTDHVCAVFTNSSDLNPTWFPSVKKIAYEHNIPYFIDDVNKTSVLKGMDFDYFVCAYYDLIFKSQTLKLPKKGSINVHLGLVDEYRGCYPTTYPILDGKTHAGITIHKLVEEIDGGPYYSMASLKVSSDETGLSLYKKLTDLAVEEFEKIWPLIKNNSLYPQESDSSSAVYHSRNEFPKHEIDLSWDKEKIEKYVRALTFPPFPKPYFMIEGKRFNIHYEQ